MPQRAADHPGREHPGHVRGGQTALTPWRPVLLDSADLGRIEEAALRLLADPGLAVTDEVVQAAVSARGFPLHDGRVRFDRGAVKTFLAEERKRGATAHTARPEVPAEIRLSVSQYPLRVHDSDTDRLLPFTAERLVAATRLLDAVADRGETASPPGLPCDVPALLQPVAAYWIAASYSRQGTGPLDPKAEAAVPWIMEMAHVLESPVRSLPVYLFSPLTLGGESVRCALRHRDRLTAVSVNGMPAPGSSAPISPGDALAQSAAETVGAALLLRETLGLPVHWRIELFPVDLRSMAMVYGSPENLLFSLLAGEVNAHFHGGTAAPAWGNIHTLAKLPDAQACAEKAGVMTAWALAGARQFTGAGTLALDEVFSPEQLLYDLEIRDQVQRLVGGIAAGCDPDRCEAQVREGVRAESFAGLDSTLAEFRDVYWHPALFDRQFLGPWELRGARTIRAAARGVLRDLAARPPFRLEDGRRRALAGVLARAWAALAGGAPRPAVLGAV